MTNDGRRRLRERANDIGITVRGTNDEVRPAWLMGDPKYDYCKVLVPDDFGGIIFRISWDHVRAIAHGQTSSEIQYRPAHLKAADSAVMSLLARKKYDKEQA